MLKKDLIFRHILHQCFEEGKFSFTQKDLAEKLTVSISTVHSALKPARRAGAVEVHARGFRVRDKEKLLLLWASYRNIQKDTVYQTRVAGPVQEIEGLVPPGVVFGAFSAFVRKYGFASADYDTVYIYADAEQLQKIKQRFLKVTGNPNLFVLKADPKLKTFGEVTPDVQTFVDLWSLPQWYAKDFLNDLKEKMNF